MGGTSRISGSRWGVVLAATLAIAGLASAQTPFAEDDVFTVPSGELLEIEAPGVMDNDHDGNGEPPPPPTAVATRVANVGNGVLLFNGNGSFQYTSDTGFVGDDTFTYYFIDGMATSNTATVTITVNGCDPGAVPTQWACWVEQAYLAKATELGLSAIVESFENGATWAAARAPATVPQITSQGINWESNFALNDISTGSGPARTGLWGFYSKPHGDQSGALNDRIYDGFTGTVSNPNSLLGVGGWIVSGQIGARIDVIVSHDGGTTTTAAFPDHSLGFDHKFFGFIDTAGFTSFEVVETDGTVNQPHLIFSDDFSLLVSGTDTTPPRVVEIGSLEATPDGVVTEGEIINVAITELMVRFSEPVWDPPGDTDPDDATNPANYVLFDDGGDGFDTVDCAGGVAPGDNAITVEVLSYTSGDPSETVLTVNGGFALAGGSYRLLVCGTTSIIDWAGNILDGDGNGVGGDDFARNFEVAQGPVPVISIDDIAVVEGDVGTTDATFTITLSTTSDSQVTVTYATSAGTATSGVDYLPASGTVVFSPQTLSRTVNVLVVGDLEPEMDESYTVELTTPVNATIGDSSGSGTIIDDDAWTWFVATDGNDINDCLTTTTACLTITEAMSRTAAGDQINVARGTYSENLILGIDLSLMGELPMGTVIDGTNGGAVVSIGPTATVAIRGFEITGGEFGGISNEGDVTVEDCWVHHNGGAILATTFGGFVNHGTALLDRVAIADNRGNTAGGVSNLGQMEIRNSTVSRNFGGGGRAVENLPGGTLDLVYSTVANTLNLGISVGDPGSTSMRGTIVADHGGANCDGAVVSLGHNLESEDSCGLQPAAGDLIATNPVLGTLAHNGGSSPTHAIRVGSSALDAGEAAGMPLADQRGVSRPQDGDLSGAAAADIGAFEALPGAIFDDGFESGDTSAWN